MVEPEEGKFSTTSRVESQMEIISAKISGFNVFSFYPVLILTEVFSRKE